MNDESGENDDDMNEIPSKMIKRELDISQNEYQHCDICFEPFSTAGDHKLVSIKCGHVFGQKCIENWLYQNSKAFCPMCKKHFIKTDIRPLFINVKTLAMENNSELIATIDELTKTKTEVKKFEEECSQLKLLNKLMSIEIVKLTDENKRLSEMREYSQYQTQQQVLETSHNRSTINASSVANFKLIQKLQISAIGGCRVMAYSGIDNRICVSCPSSVRLVSGFGVRVVDVAVGKVKKYISLHSMMIRNLDFNPFFASNLMLSCSLDKTVKLSSINTDSVVSSFNCAAPVWSCAWSNNNNIFYAGLANGTIDEIDNRKLTSPISTIWTQSGGPILSIRYICANDCIKRTGLLVSNSLGVVFLSNLAERQPDIQSSPNCHMETLLMSSKYGSSLVGTAFNYESFNLLSTFRPSEQQRRVRYLFSSVGTFTDDTELLYASDVKSIFGANSMEFMSRACFLTSKDSSNFAVGANEDSGSINVWDLKSEFKTATLYPKDVSRQKPILDLCQYSSHPISFGALNSDNLYFYENSGS